MTKRKSKDPDCQAVYYAEEVAFAGTLYAEPMDSNDLLALAAEMFLTGWWDRHKIPIPTIEPTLPGDTCSYAVSNWSETGYRYDTIRLLPDHVTPWHLSHEAAHIAQFYFYPYERCPDLETHGREFRACYYNVAASLLGMPAASELQINFDRRLPPRPEHTSGNPGWILTVPRLSDAEITQATDGLGIFPRWRLAEQAKVITTLQERLDAANPPSAHRVNGAIAL